VTAILAVWLVTALRVASVASPFTLIQIIITSRRTRAVLVDEVSATSAPVALIVASITQPEARAFVQMNESLLCCALPAALVSHAQVVRLVLRFADTVGVLAILAEPLVVMVVATAGAVAAIAALLVGVDVG